LAAFWPNQGADVIPTDEDPSEASLGFCTHVLPHRRSRSGGLESARHLLTLSRIAFGICIK
jgi:hypothetical protein